MGTGHALFATVSWSHTKRSERETGTRHAADARGHPHTYLQVEFTMHTREAHQPRLGERAPRHLDVVSVVAQLRIGLSCTTQSKKGSREVASVRRPLPVRILRWTERVATANALPAFQAASCRAPQPDLPGRPGRQQRHRYYGGKFETTCAAPLAHCLLYRNKLLSCPVAGHPT